MTKRDLKFLILRELQSARRNRGVMMAVLVFPLALWGFQLIIPIMGSGIFSGNVATEEPMTLFLINEDLARNGVNPIATIPHNMTYTLPFAFENNIAGTSVSSLNLAEFFIARLIDAQSNGLFLADYHLDTTTSKDTVENYARKGTINYWIEIPVGFATNYTNTGMTTLYLHSLPGINETGSVQTALNSICEASPFTYAGVGIQTTFTSKLIELEPEEPSAIGTIFSNLVPTLVPIILTFVPILPFVNATIADERDKRTLEALLALPVSRQKILLSKFLIGSLLSLVGIVTNILGLLMNEFVMVGIIAPITGESSHLYSLDVVSILPSLILILFLCSLLNLGMGISIASIAKDAGTSRGLVTFIIMPLIMIFPIMIFVGVPELLARTSNSPLVLLLYVIPWTHIFALLQKQLSPDFFTTNGLFGNVWLDIGFHVTFIVISVTMVMWIASKIFGREGLVN
ncbi:MAG: ABC transporter permease subunit [Candidatus Hermodarchaeota archaeon]